jgi:hypothetical protein
LREPLDVGVLADYRAAALPQAEEEAVEEHLFACDECGARLLGVIALAKSLRDLARQGTLGMVVSNTFLKRVAEEGLTVREYAPTVGGRNGCAHLLDSSRDSISVEPPQSLERLKNHEIEVSLEDIRLLPVGLDLFGHSIGNLSHLPLECP